MKKAAAAYGLLALVLGAISAFCIANNQVMGEVVAHGCTVAFLAVLTLGLLAGFRHRVRNNLLCTYQTVAYLAFALFTGASTLVFAATLASVAAGGSHYSLTALLATVSTQAVFFTYLSLPAIVTTAVFLVASNAVLIRHEGLRPTCMLGIAAAVALALANAALFQALHMLQGNLGIAALTVRIAVPYVINFCEMVALATAICAFLALRHEPPLDRNYVIVLGCSIRPDGTPRPLLAGRADRALEFARKQVAAGGAHPTLVCSGGQGPDEPVSEAASMAAYLRGKGVPEDLLLLESASTDTRENMLNSRAVIDADWGQREQNEQREGRPKTAYATTNYHVFRSGTYALQAGLEAQGLGAKTKWYFWPNAFLREFAGFLVNARGSVALALVGVVLFCHAIAVAYCSL